MFHTLYINSFNGQNISTGFISIKYFFALFFLWLILKSFNYIITIIVTGNELKIIPYYTIRLLDNFYRRYILFFSAVFLLQISQKKIFFFIYYLNYKCNK